MVQQYANMNNGSMGDTRMKVTISLSYGSTTVFKPFFYLDYRFKSSFC